jgi:hypothetical protein
VPIKLLVNRSNARRSSAYTHRHHLRLTPDCQADQRSLTPKRSTRAASGPLRLGFSEHLPERLGRSAEVAPNVSNELSNYSRRRSATATGRSWKFRRPRRCQGSVGRYGPGGAAARAGPARATGTRCGYGTPPPASRSATRSSPTPTGWRRSRTVGCPTAADTRLSDRLDRDGSSRWPS